MAKLLISLNKKINAMTIQDARPAVDQHFSMTENLAARHESLVAKYEHVTELPLNPYVRALVAFNGYYALTNPGFPGAFLTVDTNMYKHPLFDDPIYEIDLIICLDGENPLTVTFDGPTAVFNGTELTYGDPNNDSDPYIKLTFARPQGENVAATLTGSVRLPGLPAIPVTGETYNNPIAYDTYIGTYHEEVVDIPVSDPVLNIGPDYALSYLFEGDTSLTPVLTFTYNLNMYFFKFANPNKSDTDIRLIMGTSPAAGLVSNNMTVVNKKLQSSRMLQTMVLAENVNPNAVPNEHSQTLGIMSGYYPVPDMADGAYVCIEGRYVVTDGIPEYKVHIGISTDGFNAKVYLFDDSMSWENGVLTLNLPEGPTVLAAKLTRTYAARGSYGFLSKMEGTVFDGTIGALVPVNSENALNPVPLSAFGGVTMTNPTEFGVYLTIDNDLQITYIDNTIANFVYVPVMYVAAWPTAESSPQHVMLSLGTDGPKGVTCIITDMVKGAKPVVTGVWALPNATTVPVDQAETATALG